jgi:hypothetical protein
MTLRAALERFVDTHTEEYTLEEIIEYVSAHAPNLSRKGLPIRILNFTRNANRRKRPEWGPRGYEKRGYNLLHRNPNGLYSRCQSLRSEYRPEGDLEQKFESFITHFKAARETPLGPKRDEKLDVLRQVAESIRVEMDKLLGRFETGDMLGKQVQ